MPSWNAREYKSGHLSLGFILHRPSLSALIDQPFIPTTDHIELKEAAAMNHNALLTAMLSVATILLLVAPVESCVNFKAIEVGNNNGYFQIQLWDNGPNPRCSLNGYPSHDQVYDLNCDSSFGATFDVSSTHVTYTTDHGQFDFDAPGDGFAGYKACLYGCVNPGDCFV